MIGLDEGSNVEELLVKTDEKVNVFSVNEKEYLVSDLLAEKEILEAQLEIANQEVSDEVLLEWARINYPKPFVDVEAINSRKAEIERMLNGSSTD